jgi:hypothetical protein
MSLVDMPTGPALEAAFQHVAEWLGRFKSEADDALWLRSEGSSWRETLGIPMFTVIDAGRSEYPPCN